MRNSLAVFFGVLLLTSCATAQTPTQTETTQSYRQQLDIYRDMKIRLYRVADPIKIQSADICPASQNDDGISSHNLFDYPERMRPVAQSYWGLTDNPTQLYNSHLRGDACIGTVSLSYENYPRAYTDGDSIFVTPSLLEEVDDLSLALIIAHELAHISLSHMDKEPSESLERAADRFAVFMLARAGLDYRAATLQEAASKKPHAPANPTYTNTQKRAEHFRTVVLEIESLQASGGKLIP